METTSLQGCHPDSLASYLKALGVLRLVHEQKPQRPHPKGYWKNDTFNLESDCTAESLTGFFLNEYKPTPLISPWNGSTGFYPKDKQKPLLDSVRNSKTDRLEGYRRAIAIAGDVVNGMGLTKQPTGDEKRILIRNLRDKLPDLAVRWIDTCALLSSNDVRYPPLLGTGGNDGNFEFGRTFLQQLQNLFDFETGEPTPSSAVLLKASLFEETLPGLAFSGKIGQFDPLAAGGANAAPGFEGKSRVNPWDFVLMLEGTLVFQTRLTRKFESLTGGDPTYPFAVQPTPVGYGTAAKDENVRAEIWLPLWSRPARFDELQVLFGEGRVKLGGKAPKTGVDFALAISNLGSLRGLDEFLRYSFQERNGLSYFAVPLGRFRPGAKSPTRLLSQLEGWLDNFRWAVKSDKPPASIVQVHRLLETRIVELARTEKQPGTSGNNYLAVLIALGEVEEALNRSMNWVKEVNLPPIPWLNSKWVDRCYDGSAEFRLALALAGRGLYRKVKDSKTEQPHLIDYPHPHTGLRQRLVRVRGEIRSHWGEDNNKITVWKTGTLTDNLLALLRREALEAEQNEKHEERTAMANLDGDNLEEFEGEEDTDTPATVSASHPAIAASLDDIAAWIDGEVDDTRLEAIARGLALLNKKRPVKVKKTSDSQKTRAIPVPVAFALLEPVFRRVIPVQERESRTLSNNEKTDLPRVPGLLSRLEAGDCLEATDLAARRLRASNFRLVVGELYELKERTRRIGAALAFPISESDSRKLLERVCYWDPN